MDPSDRRPKLTKRQLEQAEEIYRQSAPGLFQYACRLRSQGYGADPHDLVQTTFQAAIEQWAKVGLFSPDERERWLRRVLKNKAIDHMRRQGVIDLSAEIPSPRPPSDDTCERARMRIALDACRKVIAAMPRMRRAVAFLTWHEDWGDERIAEHLRITPSTVRGHRRKARKQLKDELGPLVSFSDEDEDEPEGEEESAQ
ncbi:sigma-70 family RNA polymerase sigma factor [Sphaerisporangium sp. NPDC005289]|uniref:RNA polymerase sigma factor n=1 Tax=Sphaerisporangium sp. NPDC005289 TaxID=3155247 RepID=UPI0033B3F3E7